MRVTGTDDHGTLTDTGNSVSPFAPNAGKPGQSVSFAAISSADGDESPAERASDENPKKPSEKALSTEFADKASEGVANRTRTGDIQNHNLAL
jgi:hypothetical protein